MVWFDAHEMKVGNVIWNHIFSHAFIWIFSVFMKEFSWCLLWLFECLQVGPQEIYVVGRDDDSVAAGSEVSDDAASWETVNDNEMDTLENTREVCFCSVHFYMCQSNLFMSVKQRLAIESSMCGALAG